MSDRYVLKDAKMQLYKRRNAIRKDIELQPVTILSNTCIGGRFYHDYGARFLSPTIDSYIAPADFVRFCSNLDHYLAAQLVYDAGYEFMKNFFPFKLDDIHVCFGHTNDSIEKSIDKWNARKERIVRDNIVCICTDRIVKGFRPDVCACDKSVKEDFERLPYRKAFITAVNDYTGKDIYFLPSHEQEGMCPEATKPGKKEGRYIIEDDGFDIDYFITGTHITEK